MIRVDPFWLQENSPKVVQCRTDWMQTGTHITVNVYCKKYDPRNEALTYVEVNPIRLRIRIFFPETGLTYDSDQELRGVSLYNCCLTVN